jgi:hypothetical protein
MGAIGTPDASDIANTLHFPRFVQNDGYLAGASGVKLVDSFVLLNEEYIGQIAASGLGTNCNAPVVVNGQVVGTQRFRAGTAGHVSSALPGSSDAERPPDTN